MKKIEMFYLEHCPHCKLAFELMKKIKGECKYATVEVETHEESREKQYADAHDYFYVPCFFVDGKKVAEGHVEEADVRRVLDLAIE